MLCINMLFFVSCTTSESASNKTVLVIQNEVSMFNVTIEKQFYITCHANLTQLKINKS